jgi:hypothetical protein
MIQDNGSSGPRSELDRRMDAAGDNLSRGAKEARTAAENETATLRDKAADVAGRVKDGLSSEGEHLKSRASESLLGFADSVKTARDALAKDNPGLVSDLVGQAAEGLESLSRSLEKTSGGEMIEAVRDFGRRNPMGFIAASVLAGFAVSRFAVSSAPTGSSAGRSSNVGPSANGHGTSPVSGTAVSPAGRANAPVPPASTGAVGSGAGGSVSGLAQPDNTNRGGIR